MGIVSTIDKLEIPLQMQVNDCIRTHRYIQLDDILVSIKKLGIDGMNRSSLHRHIVKLKVRDSLNAKPSEGTIITIVERATGEVRVIKSSAPAVAIASLIAKINESRNIS